MDAEVEDALAGNSDYLRDVVTTVGEGASVDRGCQDGSRTSVPTTCR
jgi:hypothetical protein